MSGGGGGEALLVPTPARARPLAPQDGLNESRLSLAGTSAGGAGLGKRQASATDKAAKRSKLG